MSRRFEVSLHGSGLSVPVDGGEPARGFYTVRRVRADTRESAKLRAVEVLKAEPKFRSLVEATGRATGDADGITIEPERVTEVSWFRWPFSRSPSSFVFYTDEPAVRDRYLWAAAALSPDAPFPVGPPAEPRDSRAAAPEDPPRELVPGLEAACAQGKHRTYLELLDQAYVRAGASERDALRAVLRADERLDRRVARQLERISELAMKADDHEAAVRAQLLEPSLTYHYDSRDILLNLAGLWQWAEGQGLDPTPAFKEIGDISSSEMTHMIGGSAQAMIRNIADDPAYRAQLGR